MGQVDALNWASICERYAGRSFHRTA